MALEAAVRRRRWILRLRCTGRCRSLAMRPNTIAGPVLVTVDTGSIRATGRRFLLPSTLGYERRRDGAYSWGVFEDAAEDRAFAGDFLVESWLEHLRQHDRVTNADRVVQDAIREFGAATEPTVTHFIAAPLQSD